MGATKRTKADQTNRVKVGAAIEFTERALHFREALARLPRPRFLCRCRWPGPRIGPRCFSISAWTLVAFLYPLSNVSCRCVGALVALERLRAFNFGRQPWRGG